MGFAALYGSQATATAGPGATSTPSSSCAPTLSRASLISGGRLLRALGRDVQTVRLADAQRIFALADVMAQGTSARRSRRRVGGVLLATPVVSSSQLSGLA